MWILSAGPGNSELHRFPPSELEAGFEPRPASPAPPLVENNSLYICGALRSFNYSSRAGWRKSGKNHGHDRNAFGIRRCYLFPLPRLALRRFPKNTLPTHSTLSTVSSAWAMHPLPYIGRTCVHYVGGAAFKIAGMTITTHLTPHELLHTKPLC